MYVIVVGGGKTGSQLAATLLSEGYRVCVIEQRPAVFERLRHELPAESICEGDGSSPTVLEASGIREAKVLAAVTGDDDANLVIATLGRFEFNVPRIIARVNNPKNAWLFTPDMGVDVAINQSDLLARLIIEEMSLGDMMTLVKLRRGRYSLVEEKIPDGAQAVGIPIKDMQLPPNCVIAAIIRRGEIVVPRGITELEVGDEVLAVVDRPAAERLAQMFGRPRKG
jgi:trk system potassium uptake protein TrkA